MPRPDGKLYHFEIAAQKAEEKRKAEAAAKEAEKAKEKPAKVVPIKPTRKPHPMAVFKDTKERDGQGKVKITEAMLRACLDDVRNGLSFERAVTAQGISSQAMDQWRKKNRALDEAFKEAEIAFEKEMLGKIVHSARTGDVKAGQWVLERRVPGYAAVTKTELTGKDGGPIAHLTVHKSLLARVAGSRESRVKRVQPLEAVG